MTRTKPKSSRKIKIPTKSELRKLDNLIKAGDRLIKHQEKQIKDLRKQNLLFTKELKK